MYIHSNFYLLSTHILFYIFFFFFNDTATTEIYTLSLHDALPIWDRLFAALIHQELDRPRGLAADGVVDRKSTRLNSSHGYISYAVFCLKKKKKRITLPAHFFVFAFLTNYLIRLCLLQRVVLSRCT